MISTGLVQFETDFIYSFVFDSDCFVQLWCRHLRGTFQSDVTLFNALTFRLKFVLIGKFLIDFFLSLSFSLSLFLHSLGFSMLFFVVKKRNPSETVIWPKTPGVQSFRTLLLLLRLFGSFFFNVYPLLTTNTIQTVGHLLFKLSYVQLISLPRSWILSNVHLIQEV